MEFIEILLEELKKRNITKTKLAKDIGISEGSIRSWENGKQPTIDKLKKISQYLSISTDILLDLENNLTENEKELLKNFRELPEREQIKIIGVVEDKAKDYNKGKNVKYTNSRKEA